MDVLRRLTYCRIIIIIIVFVIIISSLSVSDWCYLLTYWTLLSIACLTAFITCQSYFGRKFVISEALGTGIAWTTCPWSLPSNGACRESSTRPVDPHLCLRGQKNENASEGRNWNKSLLNLWNCGFIFRNEEVTSVDISKQSVMERIRGKDRFWAWSDGDRVTGW